MSPDTGRPPLQLEADHGAERSRGLSEDADRFMSLGKQPDSSPGCRPRTACRRVGMLIRFFRGNRATSAWLAAS